MMKRLIIAVMTVMMLTTLNHKLFAQNVEQLWAQFNEEISNRLPESAGKTLDKIEKSVNKGYDETAKLQCVLRRLDVIEMSSDSFTEDAVEMLKAKMASSSNISKAVILLVLADIDARNADSHYNEVELYLDDLKNIDIQPFVKLFIKNANTEIDIKSEPTLYHFVMHKIIQHHIYDFVLEEKITDFEPFFSSPEEFAKMNFKEIGKISRYFQKLNLYDKEYSASHPENNQAFVYDEVLRLDFFFNTLKNNKNKEKVTSLYLYALTNLKENYCDSQNAPTIVAKQMEVLVNQEKYIEAMEVYNAATADDGTTGFFVCNNALNRILSEDLEITVEEVVAPNHPIPVMISYRNAKNTNMRVYKMTRELIDELEQTETEKYGEFFGKLNPIITKQIDFQEEKDYLEHRTLSALDNLSVGNYVVTFDLKSETEFCGFTVSNFAYYIENEDEKTQITVVDRYSGESLKNIDIQLFTETYNYQTRKKTRKVLDTLRTDKNGTAVCTTAIKNGIYIELSCGDDVLTSNRSFWRSQYNDKMFFQTQLFTDRAVYRPGQKVSFAGITYRMNNVDYELVSNNIVEIKIRDANWQVVEEKTFVSDDFGSFSGEFVIPEGLMNGAFTICCENGSKTFMVEEYKRPTYEIVFDQPEMELVDGQKYFVIEGKAQAYSGYGVGGAAVSYSVRHNVMFPWWRWWLNYPEEEENLLTSGELKTENDGSFKIRFAAAPFIDSGGDLWKRCLNQYLVKVKTTDNQGESHEKTTRFNDSEYEFEINFDLSEQIVNLDEIGKKQIEVKKIFGGEPAQAKVTRKFYRLNCGTKIAGVFSGFDRKIMSDNELALLFPDVDFYADNDKDGVLVYEDEISVDGKASAFPEKKGVFKAGRYRVEYFADDDKGYFESVFTIDDRKSAALPTPELLWVSGLDEKADVGDKIELRVGSAAHNANIIVLIKNHEKILMRKILKINNQTKKISYKVTEEDRGGIIVDAFIFWQNQMQHVSKSINIPYNNLNLDINLISERDIMLPGSDVKWTVKIKDFKDNPLKTNIIATLYDASLDHFTPYFSNISFYPNYRFKNDVTIGESFNFNGFNLQHLPYKNHYRIREMLLSDLSFFARPYIYRTTARQNLIKDMAMTAMEENTEEYAAAKQANPTDDIIDEHDGFEIAEEIDNVRVKSLRIRDNFNETAFFYPNLRTDENGMAEMSFTMPDALTRWNLFLSAYSQDLKFGNLRKTFTTSLPVMIRADMPRFVYQNDALEFTANVINTSDSIISPNVLLEIFDASTNLPLDIITSEKSMQIIDIQPNESRLVKWSVVINHDAGALKFRFVAADKNASDAEQHLLPVLSDKVLLTKTSPITVKSHSEFHSKIDELFVEDNGEIIENQTFDISTNPTWFAVQSLPYLAADEAISPEYTFYKFYANALAHFIAKNTPNLPEILEKWKNETPNELISNLEKNESVKAVLLQATPWVMDAKNETEQKANIAKLLDFNALNTNLKTLLDDVEKHQTVNGGWPWMEGFPESKFISTYIALGMNRLINMQVINTLDEDLKEQYINICQKANKFVAQTVLEDYQLMKKDGKLDKYVIGQMAVRELYALSYNELFNDNELAEARNFYLNKMEKGWQNFDFETLAETAMVLHRANRDKTAKLIIKSLMERARKSDEIGIYWGNLTEQVRIIEAFIEMGSNTESIDKMRLWLLTQKRSCRWENTRYTAEAIYALMMNGTNWLDESDKAVVDITATDVDIINPTEHLVFGGAFRNVLVPIDAVNKSNNALTINREYLVERISEDGKTKKYMPVNEGDVLNVGDKVMVKLKFEAGHDMEYVYVKDMRAACFEPVEQNTREHDAYTAFYLDYVSKGKHEVTHYQYVTKSGSFSGGFALIQCMYAPEFSAYTSGIRLTINKNEK